MENLLDKPQTELEQDKGIFTWCVRIYRTWLRIKSRSNETEIDILNPSSHALIVDNRNTHFE